MFRPEGTLVGTGPGTAATQWNRQEVPAPLALSPPGALPGRGAGGRFLLAVGIQERADTAVGKGTHVRCLSGPNPAHAPGPAQLRTRYRPGGRAAGQTPGAQDGKLEDEVRGEARREGVVSHGHTCLDLGVSLHLGLRLPCHPSAIPPSPGRETACGPVTRTPQLSGSPTTNPQGPKLPVSGSENGDAAATWWQPNNTEAAVTVGTPRPAEGTAVPS